MTLAAASDSASISASSPCRSHCLCKKALGTALSRAHPPLPTAIQQRMALQGLLRQAQAQLMSHHLVTGMERRSPYAAGQRGTGSNAGRPRQQRSPASCSCRDALMAPQSLQAHEQAVQPAVLTCACMRGSAASKGLTGARAVTAYCF